MLHIDARVFKWCNLKQEIKKKKTFQAGKKPSLIPQLHLLLTVKMLFLKEKSLLACIYLQWTLVAVSTRTLCVLLHLADAH